MVKRSVTLLEETIFQHVTIHRLMIYIYRKMKMSQDPLLAVIRTNILELRNMARSDPLVLIASSKTVLKTLLNFTRLSCIKKETLHFIRRLMHDVYARMRKLWEIYKVHGSYEIPKKEIRSSNNLKISVKEAAETKNRQQKPSGKSKKTISDSSTQQLISQTKDTSKSRTRNRNDTDLTSEISSNTSTVDELAKNYHFDNSTLLEGIDTTFDESNEEIQSETSVNSKDTETTNINDTKSPHKKRKIKKWSLGIFQAKKKKKVDRSNRTPAQSNKTPTKPPMKAKVNEKVVADISPTKVPLEPEEPEIPNSPEELNTPEIPDIPKDEIVPTKDLEDDENLDKCSSIVKDTGWEERVRAQREYYLNEMSKVAQRLSMKKNIVPKYDIISKITNKLGVSVTTSGFSLKELMVMDRTQLIQPYDKTSTESPEWINVESSSGSVVVALFKATRSKKRFVYECLGEGCSVKTTQLQVLHKHAILVHKPFNWDWSCSSCGTVPQINILKKADLLDMAMYHLTTYHSSSLRRNPVEMEFTSWESQSRNKLKMDSPLNNQNVTASNVNNRCSFELYKCSNCPFKSSFYSEAFDHYSLEIKGSSSLQCIYCSKTENRAHDLCEHLEMYHASSIFLCCECHYRSVSICNTITHYYDEHESFDENKEILIYINATPEGLKTIPPTYFPSTQLGKYVCKHPDRDEFSTMVGSKFVKHIMICPNQGGKRCSSPKKFECSLCNVKVGAAYRLKQHYESHQVSLYCCVYCGQGFIKLSSIHEHLSRLHMMYYPRFVIRESYDECPEEITSQYSSIIRYETELEALIEVSVEIDEFQEERSRIKLQLVSGDLLTWDSFFDSFQNVIRSFKLDDISGKRQGIKQRRQRSDRVIDLTEDEIPFNSETIRKEKKGNEAEIIEISSETEEMNYLINSFKSKMRTSGSYKTLNRSATGDSVRSSSSRSTVISSSSLRKSTSTPNSDDRLVSTIQGTSLLFSSAKKMNTEQDNTNTANPSLALVTVKDPQIIIGTPPYSPNMTSSTKEVNISPETSSTVSAKPRTPEIRVIAEAKMDNFRKLLPAASNLVKLNNLVQNDAPSAVELPWSTYRIAGGQFEELTGVKTVPNILSKQPVFIKKKTIEIPKITKKIEFPSATCFLKCPYCDYNGQGKAALSQHVTRMHVDLINMSTTGEIGSFLCVTCRCTFEAFAALHKHMEIDHPTNDFGVFRIYVQGHLLARKNIKICFLCSTLIVSLEQLYKHPDVCPFAHTTGTTLNSSIVYATGKSVKACFWYKKSEIKVNKSIVELLQPHLPTSSSSSSADTTARRAVAKKSTGPRPPTLEPGSLGHVINIKRAVAKKSTGPYVSSPPNYDGE